MKTITSSVISSKSISLTKAAKIISNFAAADNGASQAIAAYIRRASVSFNEVKQIHWEIENPWKSEKRKRKSEELEDGKGSNSSEQHMKKKKRRR